MAEQAISPSRLSFTSAELLTNDEFDEPLIANGVRCHGGYIDGKYVSPRGRYRRPAIANWRRRLAEGKAPLVHVPDRYVPPNYPSYEQAKYLLTEGIKEPVTRSLTIISIIEGFGARIRDVSVPDFAIEVLEPVEGTALAHLTQGLYEAHARDEAGHRNEGGHKQMWEAARDIGLAKPKIPDDVLLRMMSGGRRGERLRLFPQLSECMENMIRTMASVLIIETFAEDTFNWAKVLLGDPEISDHPERARHVVGCIALDEVPHVDYLSVALSELRTRTLVSPNGAAKLHGATVVDAIFQDQLRGMATRRPREQRERAREDIHQSINDGARASIIASRFESLDAGWRFPHDDDEELDILLTPPRL